MPVLPTELSTRKIRVTKLFGTDSTVGLISPRVNMKVKNGIEDRWVVGTHVDGYQLKLAASSGGTPIQFAYPMNLTITYALASGTWGFPTSSGSYSFHHSSASFFGTPPASGVTYTNSDGTHTFGL